MPGDAPEALKDEGRSMRPSQADSRKDPHMDFQARIECTTDADLQGRALYIAGPLALCREAAVCKVQWRAELLAAGRGC